MKMEPKYNPREVESGRYDEWVNSGYFNTSTDKSKNHIRLLFHHQM